MTRPSGEPVHFRLVYEGMLPPEALGLVEQGDISHLNPADVAAVLGPIATGTSLRMTFETPADSGPRYDEGIVSFTPHPATKEPLPTVTMAGFETFADRRGYSRTEMRSIMAPLERAVIPGGERYQAAIAPYAIVSPLVGGGWRFDGLHADLLPELAQRLNLSDLKLPALGKERLAILDQLASALILPKPTEPS